MRFGRRARWATVGLLLGLCAGVLGTLQAPRAAPPDFMGHAVVQPAARDGGPTFEVRRDCRIARFGVAPWLPPGKPKDAQWERMTRLWLGSIGMPVGGHTGALARLRGEGAGPVYVGNTTGAFHTTYRAGDRYVSCLGSTTRFATDEVTEAADSFPYEFAGKKYDLAIIRRCGNVTLLPPAAPPAWLVPAPGPAAVPQGGGGAPIYPSPGGGYYSPPIAGGGGGALPFPVPPVATVHEVPEPSVIALLAVGAVGLVLFRKKK